jgi:hypothetical protein
MKIIFLFLGLFVALKCEAITIEPAIQNNREGRKITFNTGEYFFLPDWAKVEITQIETSVALETILNFSNKAETYYEKPEDEMHFPTMRGPKLSREFDKDVYKYCLSYASNAFSFCVDAFHPKKTRVEVQYEGETSKVNAVTFIELKI